MVFIDHNPLSMKRQKLLLIFDTARSSLEYQKDLSEDQILDTFFKKLRLWESEYTEGTQKNLCMFCHKNSIDIEKGENVCPECLKKI